MFDCRYVGLTMTYVSTFQVSHRPASQPAAGDAVVRHINNPPPPSHRPSHDADGRVDVMDDVTVEAAALPLLVDRLDPGNCLSVMGLGLHLSESAP